MRYTYIFSKVKYIKPNPYRFNRSLNLPICLVKMLDISRTNKPTHKIMQTKPLHWCNLYLYWKNHVESIE